MDKKKGGEGQEEKWKLLIWAGALLCFRWKEKEGRGGKIAGIHFLSLNENKWDKKRREGIERMAALFGVKIRGRREFLFRWIRTSSSLTCWMIEEHFYISSGRYSKKEKKEIEKKAKSSLHAFENNFSCLEWGRIRLFFNQMNSSRQELSIIILTEKLPFGRTW